MDDKQKMEPNVRAVLRELAYGNVINGMYETVREHQNTFQRMGITPYDLKVLLELKSKVLLLPDAFSYLLDRPGRGDYLLENFDNPSVQPENDNEKRFLVALNTYYQQQEAYKQKTECLSKIAKEHLKPLNTNSYYRVGENEELGLLVDILLNRDIDAHFYDSFGQQRTFLKKFDLYDAYQIDDNRVSLKWKAGEVLESKGFLHKGSTERVLEGAGASINKLRENLSRHKVDILRVSDVEILSDKAKGVECIRCRVDGDYQESRVLSAKDVKLLDRLGNKDGIAVRYYADILEENRKENREIANEETLERINMPYVERLIDIYKHGMNEHDVMLSKDAENEGVDSFWGDTMLIGMEAYSVEEHKKFAFCAMTEFLSDLRPGMLTDEEVVRLVKTPPDFGEPGRELEQNLMELPATFFPVIEKSKEFDRDVIDYVKVQRGIGRTTPTIAYNSMCYFLSNRLQTEWDPAGADDEYGQVVGCYYYPNERMNNPAEKFQPNLLSEKQWNMLGKIYEGGKSFIPNTAFRMNRITEVQIYPLRNGEFNIRCMVDGEQQGGRRLSDEDAEWCMDEKADKRELAVMYFADAFAREPGREMALGR